jgi:hypothetical protein
VSTNLPWIKLQLWCTYQLLCCSLFLQICTNTLSQLLFALTKKKDCIIQERLPLIWSTQSLHPYAYTDCLVSQSSIVKLLFPMWCSTTHLVWVVRYCHRCHYDGSFYGYEAKWYLLATHLELKFSRTFVWGKGRCISSFFSISSYNTCSVCSMLALHVICHLPEACMTIKGEAKVITY